MASRVTVKRALVSVYDKTGLAEFARRLADAGVELVSSGGTARALAEAGLAVTPVEDVTGSGEMLGGRVKTLHPSIHGGILADRSQPGHLDDLEARNIEPFDLVVSNLYPFEATVAEGASAADVIEQIDIGGPAMVRAAAKNHAWVGIVTSPGQYPLVADQIESGGLTSELRESLAAEAFFHTARYDAAIVGWMHRREELPRRHVVALERAATLRYGENPHQSGARYRSPGTDPWWDRIVQHSGVALSYLNLFDASAAWHMVHDIAGDDPGVVIVKHANPCGASVEHSLAAAYQQAYECDARSAFGGIVALNRPVDVATAERMEAAAQADVIIAPGYEDEVVSRLVAKRKNTRLLQAPPPDGPSLELRQINGGWLGQTPHVFDSGREQWTVPTRRKPTEAELVDAAFAWRVCGHVTSNAIVIAHSRTAWGIGAGQQNRVEAGEIAAAKAAGRGAGGALASDAFFPFPDGLDPAAAAEVAVVIQPGGAMRDAEVTARADELGIAMVLTGERQFLH